MAARGRRIADLPAPDGVVGWPEPGAGEVVVEAVIEHPFRSWLGRRGLSGGQLRARWGGAWAIGRVVAAHGRGLVGRGVPAGRREGGEDAPRHGAGAQPGTTGAGDE
jgi:hypothetical protein